ncbi:MAG TPA: hypothetical protein DCS63_05265 [Elusimicrobia bacterium]|nr:hypothetical protein [Elusimicrobiota bacterium]
MKNHIMAVLASVAVFSTAAFAGGEGISALDGLKVYAGPQVSVETPVAVPAPIGKISSVKGSYGFEPVPDPESFSGFSCRNEEGTLGHNTIDLEELARTKVGVCGNFTGMNLPKGFDLTGADLRGAQFIYSSIPGVKMDKADLTGAVFFAVDAYWTQLSEAVLTGAWVENSTFGYSNFNRVQMQKGAFRGVMLYGVQMAFANLDGIDMRGCAMYGDGASMEGTSMIGADLRNAYFTNYEAYGGSDNTTDFTGTVLRDAIYNEKSRFPFNGDEVVKRGMILRPGEY